MAALASPTHPPPWIPEDDLLLKNAIEAGASLEALAKGAVRFSRKFTVGEIRDRWLSLLYNPDVSTPASSRMVHLQLTPDYSPNFNFPSRFGSSGTTSAKVESVVDASIKRKVESVRRIYYSTRKKTRGNDNVESFGFGVSEFCNENWKFERKDGSVVFENRVGVEGRDSPNATWNMIGDVRVSGMPVGLGGSGEGCSLGSSRDLGDGSEKMCNEENVDICDGSDVGLFECDFVAITDSLMNLGSGDDGLVFMDAVEKDLSEKCSDDNLNSLPVSIPNDDRDNNVLNIREAQELISDTKLETAIGAELKVVDEDAVTGDDKILCSVSCLAANVPPSTSVQHINIVKQSEPEMECVINTEDPEIPSNDDFMPYKRFVPSGKAEPSLRKENHNPSICLSTTGSRGAGVSSVLFPHEHLVRGGETVGPLGGKSPIGIMKQAKNVRGDLDLGIFAVPRSNALNVHDSMDVSLNARASLSNKAVQEAKLSTNVQEEIEIGEDLPSFSDIEAMILEMDLCPDDLDSSDMEVSRYQNEDAKRRIIRLEQCARSCMQRSIATRGAFAVLYGRYLKYYIKETEVILGRATDDTDVDIDLGREGPANRISRRQALIKMESDGSFHLKNLGKSLMLVNGKEVATGQRTNLQSSCLIEIRGMAFVFEVDTKSVRHYVAQKQKANNIPFEWSEEHP